MAHVELKLNKLLRKIAEEHGYKDPVVNIKEIFSGGANYTSKLFTIVVEETDKDDLHLFAKVAVIGEHLRDQMPTNIFETELFVYTDLFSVYQSLEEENDVPEEQRVPFTKMYGHDMTLNSETLVLENLIATGYGSFNRFQSFDWDYASSAITELAKFHALSFAFRETRPEEFEKVLANTALDFKEGFLDGMAVGPVEIALKTIKPEYKERLEKFLDKYMKDYFVRFFAPVRHTVIIHGDYRGSNLLHRVREVGKVDIKMVDFQTIRGGCGVSDLLYFIFSGSDEKFRAQYYDKLLDHYYTEISSAMKRLHLEPEKLYTKDDFENELKEKLPFGLSTAIFGLPVLTMAAADAPTLDENFDFTTVAFKPGDLYPERLHGVVEDFIKWGIL